jgi:ABC-type glycerol-3-phosphate transport system substrate-binding protein
MKQIVKYVVMGLLIVPALLILAFGPSSDTPVPKDRVVIDYWEKWTSDEEAAMRVIVNDFNNSQDRIFVRYVSTSNVNQKTLVATAAGVPPDVAGLWDTNMVQFASLDALMPLDDLAKKAGIGPSTYKPVYWKACHYNGHLYALVSTPMSCALHYNTDQFTEVGLDPSQPPQTLQELDADAQRLDKRDARGRLIRTGFLPTVPGWYVNFSYLWFGGNIWDEQTHKFTLTDPRVVDSFKWIQSYSKRLGKDAVSEFSSATGNFDSPQNPWLNGTLTMTQQGPWMAFYVRNLNPAMSGLINGDFNTDAPLADRRKVMHWAAAAFPAWQYDPAVPPPKDVTLCEFDTLVIPRGSKHPSEAFEFMSYVTQQKVMEKLCNSHCKNSPLEAVSDEFLHHHRNPYIDVFERLADSPNAHGTPQIPIFPEVNDDLGVLVQKMALLHGEPLEELQKLQDRLQQKYDAFAEKQRARQTQ